MNNLKDYLQQQRIEFKAIDGYRLKIGEDVFFLVEPDEEGYLFNKDFQLLTEDQDCDQYVFKFGGKWYYTKDPDKVELTPLKYVGTTNKDYLPFLGIRGQYEILNGSRNYKDWCKKANWIGIKTLGICEKNTLAGILSFQLECEKNDIKPILGATYTVNRDDYRYDIKCYVVDEKGWDNLLKINKEVRINNNGFINEKDLFKYDEGLTKVLDPKSLDFDKIFPIDLNNQENLFYQLDSVEYVSGERDEWYLKNLKKYIDSKLNPVFITDAFYLDKEDSYIKKKLNTISSKFEYEAANQYFKDFSEYLEELLPLFGNDDKLSTLINKSVDNLMYISEKCNFKVPIGEKHLPEYVMTKEEKKKFNSNEDLFWYLIEKGLKEKVKLSKQERYLSRVGLEVDIIEKGGFIDYFLILWDIINWSENNGILVGVGRGSAGGSLVAYLMGITKIDPLQFNLLFERFLNEGRIGKSLPDIDCDFEGERRNEVKRYMEERYGQNQVCSVGTYNTLQLKALLKDFARLENFSVAEMNYITAALELDNGTITELFKLAVKNKRVKKFVQEHIDLVNSLELALGQPKSESIHACATIIVPKEKDLFSWIPVKWGEKDGEKMYVSEWEGGELEAIGMLKEDILGIRQLDKFSAILKSISEHKNIDIDIYNLPLDDAKVYQYFKNGWNSDVFHFGSKGLTGYCKQLKPDNIEDLIAAISLYRPGAMESNFHNEFVLRKNGERTSVPMRGWENITKNTYHILCYQEQVMEICQNVGGFDLVTTDDIRKALGKKKRDLLDSFKEQYIKGGLRKGISEDELSEQWKFLEVTSGYLFNRSHAAAYTITGYISQWLKVNYPIHFWTAAFSFAKEDKIASYISEINHTGNIKIIPPDINISGERFTTDFKNNSIAWSLTEVKQVGEKAVEQIIADRDKNGEYFSLEEFLTRHKFTGSKVNKSVIENLILSGAFDEIEGIHDSVDRKRLIDFYRDFAKVKIKPTDNDWYTSNVSFYDHDWWWILQQKKLSGFAFFNYESLLNLAIEDDECEYLDNEDFFTEEVANDKVKAKIGGYITELNIKTSKKGEFCNLILENNYEFIPVTIWPSEWEVLSDLLQDSEKKLLLITGDVVYDTYKKSNALQSNSKTEIIILE